MINKKSNLFYYFILNLFFLISCQNKKDLPTYKIKEEIKEIKTASFYNQNIINNPKLFELTKIPYKTKIGYKDYIDDFHYFEDLKNTIFKDFLDMETKNFDDYINKNPIFKQELTNELNLRNNYYKKINEIIKKSPNNIYMAKKDLNTNTITIKRNNDLLEISNSIGNFEWSNDSKNIFYVSIDEKNIYKLYKYNLEYNKSKIIYEEKDPNFSLTLRKSISDSYLFLNCINQDSNEIRYMGAKDPKDNFKVFTPRKKGIFYNIEHNGYKFIVLTNSGATNYKLMGVNVLENYRNTWEEIFPNNENQKLDKLFVNKNFAIVFYKEDFFQRIKVINLKNFKRFNLDFKDEINYEILPTDEIIYNNNDFNFSFSSLIKPEIIYNYKPDKKILTKIEQKEVFSYRESDYKTNRSSFKGKNGIINISSVYKNTDTKNNKVLIQLRGLTENDSFKPETISLLDKGLTINYIHLNGAEENSKNWFNNEYTSFKRDFLDDIINSIEYILEKNPNFKEIYALGENHSALALQIVLNRRPELFKKVVLINPQKHIFNDKDNMDFTNFKIYTSPYHNLQDKNYPNILMISDINNTENLKYVAKINSFIKNNNKAFLNLKKDYLSDYYYFLLSK
ncbi:MAG: hypothetical protein U0457_05635 [Candidatus Sericytochromatia bacterium]